MKITISEVERIFEDWKKNGLMLSHGDCIPPEEIKEYEDQFKKGILMLLRETGELVEEE